MAVCIWRAKRSKSRKDPAVVKKFPAEQTLRKKSAVASALFKREKYEKIYDDQNKFFVLMYLVYDEFVSRVSKLSHEILTIFIRNLTITKEFLLKADERKSQANQKRRGEADEHTAQYTKNRRKSCGKESPFQTSGFFFYGQQGRGARPVHERKDHGTDGGDPGPAVGEEELTHLYETGHFYQASFGKIGHDDDGDDDFIGRKTKDECHENHAIKPHQSCKRIKEARTQMKKTLTAHGNISHDPDQHTGRRCHSHRTAKDK